MSIKNIILLKQRVTPAPGLDYTEFLVDTNLAGVTLWVLGETSPSAYIDWGDGTTTPVPLGNTPYPYLTHTWDTLGIYTVKVFGLGDVMPAGMGNVPGLIALTKFNTQVSICWLLTFAQNLTSVPSVLPSNITDCNSMFRGCNIFNQNIGGWNMTNVTNMDYMFEYAPAFNQDLSSWTTGLTSQPESFSNGANATFADNANNLKPFLSDGVTRIDT